jgi:hypothetical protein
MKRGEIWSVAGGAVYAGKLRPAVIVQMTASTRTIDRRAPFQIRRRHHQALRGAPRAEWTVCAGAGMRWTS